MSAAEHSSTRFCKAVLAHQASSPTHQAFSSGVPACIATEARQQVGCPAAGFLSALQLYQGISVKGPASSTVPGRRIYVQGPASSPVPVPATGSQTGILTLTPHFPGTPARFFACPGWSRWRRSLGGGHVAAYIYYCIVRYSIMARV
jgi:hypothetical protein